MTTDTLSTDSGTVKESALLDQVRTGNPASCGPLVDHLGAPVFHYLYWLTGTVEEATTLFKDTLLHLYLNPSRARKEASARQWVYGHVTQLWLQDRQRQRQRRSSLDNILRGGLKTKEQAPWVDWMTQCPEATGPEALALEPTVDIIGQLSDQERAVLLLTNLAKLPLKYVATTLRISPRKTRKRLMSAFAQLSLQEDAPTDAAHRKVERLARRRALGIESNGQAKALDKLIENDSHRATQVNHCNDVLQTLEDLPRAAAPPSLTQETITHLEEGHAALETRIATWGFRFMQVTVPLFILAILAIILLPAISRSREMARRADATENLRELGVALKAYSDSAYGNRYPALTDEPGLWVPDLTVLYPTYIKDPALLVNPSLNDPALVAALTEALNQSPPDWKKAHALFAQSYVYTGYALLDAEALASFMALRDAEGDRDMEGDLETVDRRFYRLRKGVDQFFAGNLRALPGEKPPGPTRIPVMFEVFSTSGFGANPEGANVLYLDGTVAYIPFGTSFPVDSVVMELLEEAQRR